MLLLAGWFDPFLPTQLDDFKQIVAEAKKEVALKSRIIIGPWAHAEDLKLPNSKTSLPYRMESIKHSIPWFDEQLGLSKTFHLNLPRVKLFVMGENRWRDENEWPLARTQYTSFYLHSMGGANTNKGDGWLDTLRPQKN